MQDITPARVMAQVTRVLAERAMTGRTADGAASRRERVGRWRVWSREPAAMPTALGRARSTRLAAGGDSLHRSKHADTYRWARPGGDVYVKVYRRYRRWTALKDWFRPVEGGERARG